MARIAQESPRRRKDAREPLAPIPNEPSTTNGQESEQEVTPPNAPETDSDDSDHPLSSTPTTIPPSFYPHNTRSLSGIALRSFSLGATFTLFLLLTLTLAFLTPPTSRAHPLWRPPFFLTTLSAFHFLEFLLTARYNPSRAYTSSFLLSHNGTAYNIAHASALLECTLTALFAPAWQARCSNAWTITLGLALVVAGQALRSAAMATAGESFNHVVQSWRNAKQRLVTRGVYAWTRHPSYAGFFWWGVGGQMVLGNVGCGVAYVVVLWGFFNRRIGREEGFLGEWFDGKGEGGGESYEAYRGRVGTGIPFIR